MLKFILPALLLLTGCGSPEPDYVVLRSESFKQFEKETTHTSTSTTTETIKAPSHPYFRESDGCSGGREEAKRLFHAACVEHDQCYLAYDNKLACDEAFGVNMNKVCDTLRPIERPFCRGEAELMEQAVTKASKTKKVFKARQKKQREYETKVKRNVSLKIIIVAPELPK